METFLYERSGRPLFENLVAAAVAERESQWRAVALELADTSDGPMTDDGRVILAEGFDWREPPLALLYQPALEEGHDGAYQVGTITSIAREDNLVIFEGTYLDTPEAQAAAELVGNEEGVSVSVDLAIKRASIEFTVPQGDTMLEVEPAPGETVSIPIIDNEQEKLIVERSTAIGLTIVPQPAFDKPVAITNLQWDDALTAAVSAEIDSPMIALYPDALLDTSGTDSPTPDDEQHLTLCVLDGVQDGALLDQLCQGLAADCGPVEASVTGVGVFTDNGDGYPVVALIDALGLGAFRADLVETLIGAGVPYKTDYDFMPHLTLGYDVDAPTALPLGNLGDPVRFSTLCLVSASEKTEYSLTGASLASGSGYEEAMVASASEAPIIPPAEWFEDPGFSEPTPLTITDEGRIYGHAAIWDSCHMSKSGYCITPPHCDYSLFHLGCVETTEGIIPTGKIVMGEGGHADLHLDVIAATQHYDKMNHCAADVRAGEDEWGIWFSGALRPGLPDETIRELRASPVSGDWRKGDLIALLAVNIGAFPVPRALVACAESGPEALAITGEGFDPGQPVEGVEEAAGAAIPRALVLRASKRKLAAVRGVKELAALARGGD